MENMKCENYDYLISFLLPGGGGGAGWAGPSKWFFTTFRFVFGTTVSLKSSAQFVECQFHFFTAASLLINFLCDNDERRGRNKAAADRRCQMFAYNSRSRLRQHSPYLYFSKSIICVSGQV